MTNKSWKGPYGKTAPVPKDDGAKLMISAFQSREFGFGLPLTEEDWYNPVQLLYVKKTHTHTYMSGALFETCT
jgi:hypothetical protein